MTEKEEAMMKWRLWKSEMYAAWLSAARKKSLLSRPKRPPRPYDYSKDDRYTTAGMLYIPKKKWVSSCVLGCCIVTTHVGPTSSWFLAATYQGFRF